MGLKSKKATGPFQRAPRTIREIAAEYAGDREREARFLRTYCRFTDAGRQQVSGHCAPMSGGGEEEDA